VQLQDIITCIPVHIKVTQIIQQLFKAFNNFQNYVNDKMHRLVEELKETKQCMVTTCLYSQTQATMVNLAHTCKLRGKYYWPYISRMIEDPNRHYVYLLHTASMDVTHGSSSQSGNMTGNKAGPSFSAILPPTTGRSNTLTMSISCVGAKVIGSGTAKLLMLPAKAPSVSSNGII